MGRMHGRWQWVAWVGLALAVGLPVGARAQLDPELGLGAGGEADTGGGAQVSVTEGDEERPPRSDEERPAREDREDDEDEEPAADKGDKSHIEAFRLGLALRLFEFESRRTTIDVAGGGTADQDTSGLSFGFFPSQLGLNLGLGFAERLVVGARLQLAVSTGDRISFTGAESDTSSLSLSFLPYFELAFNPRDTVVWNANVTLGVRSVGAELAGVDASQTTFVVGAGLGTHIFFTEGISIDPGIEFLYSTGGGSETTTTATGSTTTDFNVSGFVLGVELGMSLWL